MVTNKSQIWACVSLAFLWEALSLVTAYNDDKLSAKDQGVVDDWAGKFGGKPFTALSFPWLEKQGVCVAFAE